MKSDLKLFDILVIMEEQEKQNEEKTKNAQGLL